MRSPATKAWRRFRSLSAADRTLVLEGGALIVCIRLGLSVLPFLVLRRALHAYSRRLAVSGAADRADRVAWAVMAAARHLPIRTSCLVESLAAEAMLRRRRCPCVLRLGVRSPGQAGEIDAHAWLEYQGAIIIGAVDGLAEYVALVDRGAT